MRSLKSLTIAVIILLFVTISFATTTRTEISNQNEEGNDVFTPISYVDYGDSLQIDVEIQYGPKFAFVSNDGSQVNLAFEQFEEDVLAYNRRPEIRVFDGKGTMFFGDFDLENRVIIFQIPKTKIINQVFNVVLKSNKGEYWTHGQRFDEDVYGFKIRE